MKGRLALLAVVCSGPAATADPRDPILAGWEASRSRFTSIRYTLAGVVDAKDTSGGAKIPTPPPAGPAPRYQGSVLLHFPRQRHRLEETTPTLSFPDKSKYTTRTRISVCDGETFKSLHPRDKNQRSPDSPDMHIGRGDLRGSNFSPQHDPLFLAHGYIPSSRQMPSPGHWPTPADREEYEVRGTGVIGGRKHIILRAEPYHGFEDEYWVDPARGGAVGRYTIWDDKTDPYQKFDLDYQEVAGDWVLKGWTHTVSMRHRVVQVERITVEAVEVNPAVSDGDFDIPIKPGYIVKEHVFPPKGGGLNPAYPAQKTTRVKPGGGREVVAETGFQTWDGVPVPPPAPWWGRWWAWSAGGAAVVAALGGAFWRRARRAG
jgi:hypothetical protein